ncbi:MAG: squalene/phytoene synthase family protein [Candidatus Rokubacteria bacterium]|nr:squalene/phytoene synthase family protein [Candidatus Rokubacteria bacterium]
MSRGTPTDAAALVGSLLRRVSRSFYLSVAILPAGVRPTIGLAYLLARAADSVTDTRLLPAEARLGHLEALRASIVARSGGALPALSAAIADQQSHPAERELLERLPECFAAYEALGADDQVRVSRLLATIIQGMVEDLQAFPASEAGKLGALETRADLDRYTYLVAGCVGEFWTEVHAAHRPRIARLDRARMSALGVRFGQGLQLTNVLRDVPRDLRQGRSYLPRQELCALGLSPADLLEPDASAAARPLLLDLLGLARSHYEAGWAYTVAIPRAEWRMRLSCAWPLLIGLRTLDRLARAERWLDPDAVVKVPRGEVYGLMASSLVTVWSSRAFIREARRLLDRLPART